ncbi:hypothetical protein GLOTRDRAFT_125022 [Gloeophyllum trabeum ATCC 11539]|uniref:Uncharacterized protein n=1 Tax=Gloeophyllum trabeum (strain ATCC 11539 / FP-39264 / Madison 617) TaxID=670483 RepID=S7QPL6_GLOTA|nr:uncharacterized protein GLOTRDRAFT_125022 [Gloeophyllum trabeum ATCC 11539]EPQ61302.1 hypothetical protein GLOTRDRAFT_125022 [Gloeophyllum trabeum ATCC 11539]
MPFTNPWFGGPAPQFGFGGYPVQHPLHAIPASSDVSDSDFAKLQALNYVPSDCGVETLPREDWSSSGFTTLSWDWFVKKHHAFIEDVCNMCFV